MADMDKLVVRDLRDQSTSEYDIKDSVARDELSDVKADLLLDKYNTIRVLQGMLLIADGKYATSTQWCYTPYTVPSNIIITTKNPLRMYLIAYNKYTGAYVGAWNGSQFNNTYTSNGFMFSIDFNEWSSLYPDYVFKLDFYDYQSTLTPTTVKNGITVLTKTELETNYNVITHLDGWEQGSFESGVPTQASTRVRHIIPIQVEAGSVFSTVGTDVQFYLSSIDDVGNTTGSTSWETNWVVDEPHNFRILLKKRDESSITLADVQKLKMKLIVKKPPSLKIHVVSQYSIGDAMILKTSDKKAILIDIGRYQDYARLKSALISEGIAKIDYVIISHYHSDHINTTSLTNLIGDFDLTECKFILPPTIPTSYVDPDGDADVLRSNESGVISLLNTNNISYINEYNYDMRHMWLCGIRFDFYNMDHSSWYTQNADYNQMSIVCVANVGNNTVFFTGDMGNPLETKLLPILNRTVTIAKFGHHGLNGNPNLDFWHKIKPELLFATTPEVWHDEMIANSQQIRFANYNGIKFISAHVSGGKIIINVDPDSYSTDGYNYMLDNLSSEEYFNYVL